ncbi:MAG: hypothetical protein AcusKO_45800 [Acuticoccus sp.]
MGDRDKCRELLDIVPETAVLAFDVVGWSKPADAQRIAASKTIQQEINKALTKEATALAKKHFKGDKVSQEDAVKFLKTVPKPLLDAQKKEAEKRLKCAFNESPIGVWLDKNSWILWVFVPIVVGGAGTYMYVAKTGDLPASWATSMAKTKKSFDTKHLGKITLGTHDVTFVPSERKISVLAFGEMKWERLAVKLTLGGGVSDGSVSSGAMGLDVSAKISKGWSISADTQVTNQEGAWGGASSVGFAYKGTGAASDMSLFFKASYAYGQADPMKGLPIQTTAPGPALSLGLNF